MFTEGREPIERSHKPERFEEKERDVWEMWNDPGVREEYERLSEEDRAEVTRLTEKFFDEVKHASIILTKPHGVPELAEHTPDYTIYSQQTDEEHNERVTRLTDAIKNSTLLSLLPNTRTPSDRRRELFITKPYVKNGEEWDTLPDTRSVFATYVNNGSRNDHRGTTNQYYIELKYPGEIYDSLQTDKSRLFHIVLRHAGTIARPQLAQFFDVSLAGVPYPSRENSMLRQGFTSGRSKLDLQVINEDTRQVTYYPDMINNQPPQQIASGKEEFSDYVKSRLTHFKSLKSKPNDAQIARQFGYVHPNRDEGYLRRWIDRYAGDNAKMNKFWDYFRK